MHETVHAIVIPYTQFLARRERRLRVMAELIAQVHAQTIEGELLHVHIGPPRARNEGEPLEAGTSVDARGSDRHRHRHMGPLVRGLHVAHRVAPPENA